MLLRVKIKNFTSFFDEVEFNMFPNLKRKTFANHIYSDYKVPILKQSAIYGANGSGKSNFLEGLQVIKGFSSRKDFSQGFSFEKNKFLLAGEKNTLPSSFSIEFENEGVYFLYSFEINNDVVVSEELYESGLGKSENVLLFSRNKGTVTTTKVISDEVKKIRETLLSNNPKSSLLSLNQEFPIIDDEKVKSAFSWFDKKMQILSLQSVAPGIIHKAEKDKKFFSFMNKILANTDLGIDQVVIDRKKPEDMFKEREDFLKIINGEDAPNIYGENRRILYWVDTEKTKKVVKRFLFEQTGIKGYHGQLDYNTQSDGTVAMLNLLPAVYDIMNDDCLFCIDEIENSIHPNLILALLNFFSRTKTKGQLIYTTHEALLLGNQSELRPDEIWLAEKREGNTKMYSLNDFKLHNTLNIENGYLAGRFGAIPRIENLDIDIENHADVK